MKIVDHSNPDLETVKYLIEKGADINHVTHGQRSVLFHALCNPNATSELIHFLLNAGAAGPWVDAHGIDIVHAYRHYSRNVDETVIQELLARGFNKELLDAPEPEYVAE